jgi:nitroimidazol reductase NimA-like FMN-containing flavoprotein (pyridoxamine 5'-phosphate oxidase superfamily)
MRGITLTSIADAYIHGARNRYLLSLHPVSVRTELVRARAYYILWIKANCVQDIDKPANFDEDAVSDQYSVSSKNKVRQLREKAAYDRATVHRILDAGLLAQVGFVQDGSAVVVPMIYGRAGDTLFLHGARKARVIRLLEQNNEACVNVTLVDGLVFARSAFNSSMRYRSVTVFGSPRLIDSTEDKLHAIRVISEHSMPGRWDELRAPLPNEIKMTGVIAIDIRDASAKEAAGMPDDEDADYEIPIWAGVLPLKSTFGTLIDDDRLLPDVEASATVTSLQRRTL